MDRIYNRAEDKNSANIIVYGKASDTKAYSDKACTMQCTTSELKNAFMKGCVVVIGDDMYYPVALTVASSTKIATLTYAKSGSTAGTAATATLVSVAD
jgi:hypothetical protein|nr:MAG TPA: hypothetical protein [Caudoviricetes sp.]